ncbi:MAG: polysaccharide biosynthesis protein [Planctomycetota bacterium]
MREARLGSNAAVVIGTAAAVRSLRSQMLLHELAESALPWPCGCVLIEDAPGVDPGLPVLGTLDQLGELRSWNDLSVALVTMPSDRWSEVEGLCDAARRSGLEARAVPTLDDLVHGRWAGDAGSTPRLGVSLEPAALIGREPYPIDESEVENLLRGRVVLVTGAGGSIGSELAMIAARFGPARLVLMERSENALFEIDRRLREAFPDVERAAILHDVVDAEGTLAYVREHGPDVVFHAAAHKHVPLMEDHPAHAVTNNLFGTKAIADAARACGAERFVLISSDKAVNPTSVMGATKRLAERYVQGLQSRSPVTRFSMVRFGNVLASASSVLPIWSSQLAAGRAITVTDARMTRYFMTIPEAASLVIQSAATEHDGLSARVFVLDMGEPVRILELAERLCRAHGLEPVRLEGVDSAVPSGRAGVVLTGVRPGEKLHEELAYSAERLVPTGRPGINAWASPEDAVDLAALLADMRAVRGSRDREAVLAAIRRHVPEMVSPAAGERDETSVGSASIPCSPAA